MKGFLTGLMCAAAIAMTPVALIQVAWADTDDLAAQEAVAKHNTKKSEGRQRICKYQKKTGSHMKKRICRQKQDWDRITAESKETVERINTQAQGSGIGAADS